MSADCAQFIADDLVALFEFEVSKGEVCTKEERHYRLVPNDDLSDDELDVPVIVTPTVHLSMYCGVPRSTVGCDATGTIQTISSGLRTSD